MNLHNKTAPLIHLENLSYSYHTPLGETKALENISFMVREISTLPAMPTPTMKAGTGLSLPFTTQKRARGSLCRLPSRERR